MQTTGIVGAEVADSGGNQHLTPTLFIDARLSERHYNVAGTVCAAALAERKNSGFVKR